MDFRRWIEHHSLHNGSRRKIRLLLVGPSNVHVDEEIVSQALGYGVVYMSGGEGRDDFGGVLVRGAAGALLKMLSGRQSGILFKSGSGQALLVTSFAWSLAEPTHVILEDKRTIRCVRGTLALWLELGSPPTFPSASVVGAENLKPFELSFSLTISAAVATWKPSPCRDTDAFHCHIHMLLNEAFVPFSKLQNTPSKMPT
ncbi:hypothetical protein MSG28_015592 [Choristoneura fumiferana]|uniref:Uncharacterized protein n=1 Tax=Choristoneura fumiferana TaxID=7141 RepID=A0ACC0KAR4_CHOFU|nr:hypothetical protein MSG28_015592 [Choristoneura fumiferana]